MRYNYIFIYTLELIISEREKFQKSHVIMHENFLKYLGDFEKAYVILMKYFILDKIIQYFFQGNYFIIIFEILIKI